PVSPAAGSDDAAIREVTEAILRNEPNCVPEREALRELAKAILRNEPNRETDCEALRAVPEAILRNEAKRASGAPPDLRLCYGRVGGRFRGVDESDRMPGLYVGTLHPLYDRHTALQKQCLSPLTPIRGKDHPVRRAAVTIVARSGTRVPLELGGPAG